DTRTSYVPGSRPVREYVPFEAVVAVAFVTPARTPWTVAPEIAEPPVVRVTVPLIVPATSRVYVTPRLCWPATVTITEPLVVPEGTGVVMLVLLQAVGVAIVPLNVTVLVPCVEPK